MALVRIAFQLNFLNFVLPFRLGELSYPVLMRRHYGHGLLHSAGVLLLARLFDLATVVSILLGAAAVLQLAGGAGNAVLALGALGLGLAPFGLSLLGRALRRWIRAAAGCRRHRCEAVTAGLDSIRNRRVGLTAVVLSFAIWLLRLAAIWCRRRDDNCVRRPPPCWERRPGTSLSRCRSTASRVSVRRRLPGSPQRRGPACLGRRRHNRVGAACRRADE